MSRQAKVKVSALVEAKVLRDALKNINEVVERRNTIPILSYVLIRSGPSTMSLVATDMDVEIRQQIDLARAGENGSFAICVCARTLGDVMRKLPADADVEMVQDDGKIVVLAGRSRFALPTLPVDDFPEMVLSGIEWKARFEMPKIDLIALIASTGFAMSSEETRYYLNGILLHWRDETLLGAATDGHRLARFHCELPDGAEVMDDSIISRKVVGIVDKLMDAIEAPALGVDICRGKVRFTIGAVELTAKLIEGTFPDYTRVIPTGNDKALWFEPKVLAQAVDRVTTISSDKTRVVQFAMADDMLTLRVVSPENGIATEDVPCQYHAEPLTVGLNGKYVLDILSRLTGENAVATFGDPTGPTMWRDDEEARRLFVLMPARV